jgi:hypothetical protein
MQYTKKTEEVGDKKDYFRPIYFAAFSTSI